MIGAGDAFLTTLTGLVRRLPVFPLFGDGSTRLQPVFVGDVAEAAASALIGVDQRPGIHELGGPAVRTYRELVELVMHHCGRRRVLLPVPFPVWDGLAAASRVLPVPPLTTFSYYPGQIGLPNEAAPRILNKSWTLTADIEVPESGAEGMIATHGGLVGGYGLYVRAGKPTFAAATRDG